MAVLRNQVWLFRPQVLFNIPKMLLHSYELYKKVPIRCNLTDTDLINKKDNIINNLNLFKSIDQVIIILLNSLYFMISVFVYLLDV